MHVIFFFNRHLCWSLKEFRQISVRLSGWDSGVTVPREWRLPLDETDVMSLCLLFRAPGTSLQNPAWRLSSEVSFTRQNSTSATCVVNLLRSQLVHIKVSPLGCASDCGEQIPLAWTPREGEGQDRHRGIRHRVEPSGTTEETGGGSPWLTSQRNPGVLKN